jgi:hypothetical protein
MRAVGNRTALESSRDPRAAFEVGRAGLVAGQRLGQRNSVVIGNAAGAAQRVGEWTWAREILDEALTEEFEESDRAELLAGSIAFGVFLGEPVDEQMSEVEQLLKGATDPYRIATLEWTKGFVAFSDGRLGEARERYLRGIGLVAAPEVLPFAARAALWDRDADAARADLAELDASGVHGPALEADRTTIRAGIAALEGRTADALVLYREARRAWGDLGLAWDEAMSAVDMAIVLDPALPEVQAAAALARDTLGRLGAKPILERLEGALTLQGPPVASSTAGGSRAEREADAVPSER